MKGKIGGVREEAVTVNQRALIDKILARYSTQLTLFRELLQNANDARATKLQIRFTGTGYWQEREHEQQQGPQGERHQREARRARAQPGPSAAGPGAAAGERGQLSFTGLRLCNDGMVFREEDWVRLPWHRRERRERASERERDS